MDDYIVLKSGDRMPRFGMGTWYLGESKQKEKEELKALQTGIEAGIKLIDTAEMYGNGKSERLIGKAVASCQRENLFLVSKVLPSHAGERQIFSSLDETLRRLRTDYLDLYLLHWRGSVPLQETVCCMEELVKSGKIKQWGVSNFDTEDMEELYRIPNGNNCAVNQVLYHMGSRGVEYDLLPWLKRHHIPLMAYCPLAQAGELRTGMLQHPVLEQVAKKYSASKLQILLAFVLHDKDIIAIPRSGKAEHVLENWKAKDIVLKEEDYRALESAFPAPNHKTYLDIV